MSTVVMYGVVSVDGFVAGADDQLGPLFDWQAKGEVALGGGAKVPQAAEARGPAPPGLPSLRRRREPGGRRGQGTGRGPHRRRVGG
ncbi:hypothetical protein [Streptomyces sp. NPDC058335]|uniref:hypothetical protein n=1 Tax=Streptomyces sp. NPDC058335 TaxID=3346451 RepID=UPI0036554598